MIGQRLGPYEITAKLGEGGMGQVWKAKDFHLGRDVAIKVLPEGFTQDPERLQRFEREARLLAQLNHPNIAQIYGFETSGETRALVMELIEGPTLAERLEAGLLPFDESLSVSLQIAHALEEAHEKGIVHRDLKPQNIKASIDGRVKVLDFGLAKAVVASRDESSSERFASAPTISLGETREGTILGTAAYMAPEQAKGSAVDRRADVWSFGAVLYELFSGRRLFGHVNLVETLGAVLHEEIDFGALPPELPARLREIVRRCLERDAKRRLRDIGEARIVLEELARGGAAPARLAEGVTKRAVPSVAVLPFVNLSADPENEFFADGITEDVIAHLAKVRTLKVISRTSVMAFKRREKNLRDIAALLGAGAVVEGSVRRAGRRVRIVAELVDPASDEHLWAEIYDRELDDIFAIQTDVALKIVAALRAELTPDERARIGHRPTSDLQAYELFLQGRNAIFQFRKDSMEQAITLFERAIARDGRFALAYANIAFCYAQMLIEGKSGLEPEEAFGRARAAISKSLALDPNLAEAHGVAGVLRFVSEFDWQGAEAEIRLALRLSPGSADLYDHWSWLCSSLSRHDEAIEAARRAQELDPVAHPSDLGNALLRAGRAEEGLAEAQLSMITAPNSVRVHSVAGWAKIALGRVAEGIASLERAVALDPETGFFKAQLGQALAQNGDVAGARRILDELREQAQREFVSPYTFAYVHTGLGDYDAAIDCLEQAFELRSGAIYGIRGSHLFTALHGHPRFEALLGRMNLPPTTGRAPSAPALPV
jgi:TolB-like protein/Flp pilus assembly protein TadD